MENKNKKGFYFTVIVLFCIILLLLTSFQVKKEYSSEGMKTRILTTNNFIKSMEKDASRAIYISSYRTMIVVLDYMTAKHDYLDEKPLDEVFADALFNGSLQNTLNFVGSQGILENSSLRDWQARSSFLARATGLNLTFEDITPETLEVTQQSPWAITISIAVNYNISDPISGVNWKRDTRINASLPIINTFEDPLYAIEFGSACGNKVVDSDDLKPLAIPPTCGSTNLTVFVDTDGAGSRYVNSNRAPSYLDRITGNLSCFREKTCTNPNGIESLMNIPDMGLCGYPIDPTSTVVDFRYSYSYGNAHVAGDGSEPWIYLDQTEDFPPYGIYDGCAS